MSSHPTPVAWQYSRAKEILVEKLRNGDIPLTTQEMGPKAVYDLNIDGQFSQFKYENFRANLLSLRKGILKEAETTEVTATATVAGSTQQTPAVAPDPWRFSRAKAILTEMLESGKIPLDSDAMTPRQVYDLNVDGMFWQYKYSNFCNNLYTLRKSIELLKGMAEFDRVAFEHDRALKPRGDLNIRGEPFWPGSEAEEKLKADIDEGRHLRMKPETLWLSRPPIYGKFKLKTFRNHLYQELRSCRERSYWLNKKRKKEKRRRGEEDDIGDATFDDGDDGRVSSERTWVLPRGRK